MRLVPRLLDPSAGSGPLVARTFHRLLALAFLVAWLSLGVQLDVLVGRRGLLPAEPFLAQVAGAPILDVPTIFRWGASDAALHAGVWAGALLALAALAGARPRLCFALLTALYLSYAVVCRAFLSFQWDNLLLECGLLAALLPRDRPARWAHVLFRVLLFKLYWESGLAKWQSPIGDWQDGSAMTFYYETAPLPARFAHAAHAMPEGWHHFESWFTLAFELAVPFAFFAGRRPRLFAAAVLTVFQLANIATANYGFFAWLSIALHVFLVDERDARRARAAIERRAPAVRRARARLRWLRMRVWTRIRRASPRAAALSWIRREVPEAARRRLRRAGAALAVFAYVGASMTEGLARFGGSPALLADLAPLRDLYRPLRVVSTYHLFAAVTRARIEPEVQTTEDGVRWTAHDLRYKPGDPARAPALVAPHQPRVDFQLWFYGLSFQRGTPDWVHALLYRICRDPGAVQALFPAPLPGRPRAARMAFFQYHFTSREELSRTGHWWTRTFVGASRPLACGE